MHPQQKIPKLFSDAQVAELQRNPEYRNFALRDGREVCPTCEGTGEYRLFGESYMCPVDDFGHEQLRLFKLYCLANIPYEFMTIPWELFPKGEVKKDIDGYLKQYAHTRRQGLGYEFYGDHGVGKSWAAAHVEMEIAKLGYSAWFIQFVHLKSLYEDVSDEERLFTMGKLRESEVLVIDDVTAPWSPKMQEFYAEKLEATLRYRTHCNFPTILTTNISPAQWGEFYPRVYNQLSNKQQRAELSGKNYRSKSKDELDELAAAGERRPIV